MDITRFLKKIKVYLKESFSPCYVLSVIDSWPISPTILKPKQVEILGILDKKKIRKTYFEAEELLYEPEF